MIAMITRKRKIIVIIFGIIIFLILVRNSISYSINHDFPEIPIPRDDEICMGYGIIEHIQEYYLSPKILYFLKTKITSFYCTECYNPNSCYQKYIVNRGWKEVNNSVYCKNVYSEITVVIHTPYIIREYIKQDNQRERISDRICIIDEVIDEMYSLSVITIIRPSFYYKIEDFFEPE